MAGPLLGILGKAGRRDARHPGRLRARRARRRGAHRLRHRPPARPRPARPRWCRPTSTAFAEGLDVTEDDVLLYLALREAAHQRLFAHVPWLREHLIGAVTDYAQRHRDQRRRASSSGSRSSCAASTRPTPSRCRSCSRAACSTCRSPPRRRPRCSGSRSTLALVEGWVDEVVGQATAERMPAAAKLQEAVRRRRAAGGPAEQTFAALVGLELRPRRLRDASTLWGSLRTRQGTEARDGVWMHPDLLPTAADLDDPLGFREDADRAGRAQRGRLRRRAAQAARRRRRGPAPTASDPPRRRARRAARLGGARRPSRSALRERYVAHLARPPRRADPRAAAPTTSPRARWCSSPTASGCC